MRLCELVYDHLSFRSVFGPLLFRSSQPSDLDIKVLLKYLERELKVIVYEDEVIKFTQPGQSQGISPLDRDYLELKIAVGKLSEQVIELQQSVAERSRKAREYVALDRKEMARSYLKSKISLQDVLNKRLKSLDTIQDVLLKVETAFDDIRVMEAYETSSKALRDLLSHPSLQRDNVERTMNRLSDALADHADIERAMIEEGELAQGAAGLSAADEEALDAELATLAVEEKQKTHVDERRHATEHNLGAIPTVGNLEQRDSIAREPVPAS